MVECSAQRRRFFAGPWGRLAHRFDSADIGIGHGELHAHGPELLPGDIVVRDTRSRGSDMPQRIGRRFEPGFGMSMYLSKPGLYPLDVMKRRQVWRPWFRVAVDCGDRHARCSLICGLSRGRRSHEAARDVRRLPVALGAPVVIAVHLDVERAAVRWACGSVSAIRAMA